MLDDMLDKTLMLETPVSEKGTKGGMTQVYRPRKQDIPCAIWPASSATRIDFARKDMTAQFEIATADDIAAVEQERITINGKVYLVIGYLPFENEIFGESVYVTVVGKRNQ